MRTLISSAPEAIQSVAPTTVPEAKQTTVARSRAARAHTIVARVLLGGVALQIFFAGLGVFNVSSFLPHMILGTLVILGSLALPLIAWRGRLDATLTSSFLAALRADDCAGAADRRWSTDPARRGVPSAERDAAGVAYREHGASHEQHERPLTGILGTVRRRGL